MIIKNIKTKGRVKKRKFALRYGTALFNYFIRADGASQSALDSFESEGAHQRAHDIGTYMTERDVEAVLATRSINIPGSTSTEQLSFIQSAIENSAHDDVAVQHLVVSRRRDENGKDEDFSSTMKTVVAGLGAERCLIFWAVHSDTGNRHAHLLIVWLDHKTGVKVSRKQWDVKAAHAAIAVSQKQLGWEPEANAIYSAVGNRILDRNGQHAGDVDSPATWAAEKARSTGGQPYVFRPDKHQQDYEAATGLMCRTRVVHEIIAPILDDAKARHLSIDNVISILAQRGVGLRRERKGVKFEIDGKLVNASTVRRWSCAKIEASFGRIAPGLEARPVEPCPEFELHDQNDPKNEFFRQKRNYDEKAKAVRKTYMKPQLRPFRKSVGAGFKSAEAKCQFPAFENWLDGTAANIDDPAETYNEQMQVRWFRAAPKIAWQSWQPRRSANFNVDNFQSHSVGFGGNSGRQHVLTDFGHSMVIEQCGGEDVILNALIILQLRGADHISCEGFSRKERKFIKQHSAEIGITAHFEKPNPVSIGPTSHKNSPLQSVKSNEENKAIQDTGEKKTPGYSSHQPSVVDAVQRGDADEKPKQAEANKLVPENRRNQQSPSSVPAIAPTAPVPVQFEHHPDASELRGASQFERDSTEFDQQDRKLRQHRRQISSFLDESIHRITDLQKDSAGIIWPYNRRASDVLDVDFKLADEDQRKELTERYAKQENEMNLLHRALFETFDKDRYAKGKKAVIEILPAKIQKMAEDRLSRQMGEELLQRVTQEVQEEAERKVAQWRNAKQGSLQKKKLAQETLKITWRAGVTIEDTERRRMIDDAYPKGGVRAFGNGRDGLSIG